MAANVANTEDISHFSNQDDTEEKGEGEEVVLGFLAVFAGLAVVIVLVF